MPPKGHKRPQEPRLSVRCIVSERWLSFPAEPGPEFDCGEALAVHVMTRGANDKPHRICELIVTRQDLLDTLRQIAKAAN